MKSPLARSLLVVCALTFVAGLSPRAAQAGPDQLCRSLTTIALAPTDILLGPYIVAYTEYWGMVDQDDSFAMKSIGAVPGFVFLSFMQVGGALLRVIAGAMEFVPGLFTFFQENSPDALYTSQDESEAIFSEDYGPCPVRIGVSYNTINQ